MGSGPLWGAPSREIMLDGRIGVRIGDTLFRKLATGGFRGLPNGWLREGWLAHGLGDPPTPPPPTPQDPPGGPPPGGSGGVGGSGVGAWVGPRARALTTLPLTTHLAAPDTSPATCLPKASRIRTPIPPPDMISRDGAPQRGPDPKRRSKRNSDPEKAPSRILAPPHPDKAPGGPGVPQAPRPA